MYLLRRALLIFICGLLPFAGVFASVDINTASAEEMAKAISGVGIQKATLIVKYREQHGAFKNVEQLARIKGIGSKTIERNRDVLSVGESKN